MTPHGNLKKDEMANPLQEEQDRLRLALQVAQVGVWEWRIVQNEVSWSAETEEIFGLQPGSFSGDYSEYMERTHPADRNRVQETIDQALADRDRPIYQVEHRILLPDGQVRLIQARGQVLWGDSERPIRLLGTVTAIAQSNETDVAEKKQAELALREREDQLHQVLQSVGAGAWKWEIETNQAWWSDENFTVMGLNPAESEARYENWLAQVHPEDRGMAEVEVMAALEEARDLDIEFRVVYPNGEVRWINDVGRLMLDDQGQPLSMHGIQLDITERKQAEQNQARLIEQLQALRQIGLELATRLDLPSLLQSITSRAITLTGSDDGGLYLYRPERHVLEWASATEEDSNQSGFEISPDQGLAGAVFKSRQAILVQEYQSWPERIYTFPAYPKIRILAIPVVWGEKFLGVLQVIKEEPKNFTLSEQEMLILFATQAAAAIHNAQLFEAERQRRQELETLYHASLVFSQIQDPAVVGEQILTTLEQIGPYRRAAIALIDDEGDELELLAHAHMGMDEDAYRAEFRRVQQILLHQPSMMKWVAQNGAPIRTGQAPADPRYLAADPAIQSELTVPLRVAGRTIGVLNVENEMPNAFSEHDEQLLTTLSSQAAVAIENARLFRQVQEGQQRMHALSVQLVHAQEAERRRLSIELHDELGQVLSVIHLRLLNSLNLPGHRLGGVMLEIATIVESAVEMVRSLSLDLRPGMLDDFGLDSALRWLVERQREATQTEIDLTSNLQDTRLTADLETACYRIVQEALNNAARHAQACRISVRLTLTSQKLILDVEDNGIGFDVDQALRQAAQGRSLGLLGIQERIELTRGRLTLLSSPGQGSAISVVWPLHLER